MNPSEDNIYEVDLELIIHMYWTLTIKDIFKMRDYFIIGVSIFFKDSGGLVFHTYST